MNGRFQLGLMIALLIVAGLGLAMYKHFALGFPLFSHDVSKVWSIEAWVTFKAEDEPAQASLTLPDQQSGLRILDESFASPGYGINQIDEGGQQRAVWSIRQADGRQDLFYKVKLHLEPDYDKKIHDEPEAVIPPVLPEPYQTAALSLLKQVKEHSSDPSSFAGTLINHFIAKEPSQNTNMLLGMTEEGTSLPKLLVNLLNMSEIPARIVRGLHLEDGRRRQPIVDMIEVYDGNQWHLFNPRTAKRGTPEDFFLWQRGAKSLLDVMGGVGSDVTFSMISRNVPTRELAITEAKQDGAALIDFSIYTLPLEVQNAFKIILLIPIGVLVVLVMRIIVGLKTSGTFMPVLIAMAFLQTQLLPGLTIFISLVSIGLWIRSFLSQQNMLLVARLGAVIIVVILIMAAMSILSWKLGITQALTVTFFPMIILAWTIERMSILWEEEGPKHVVTEGGGSLLVATMSYLLMSNPIVEQLTFNFPELMLTLLGLVLLLGQYTGYRLLELKRFYPLAHSIKNHQ
ncbi:inactive transglutaminase family protein [uncultured Endozoicomonas sp.]|uniref:inactive transglutaminase family protein n=1 Tax=uncultured Endozoicomonas sp. TaxID=432652 RepID=UPI002620402A|nr:inactive transglutaminase family protein [uncultured Endozoicomonas sp.]